ncbi:hypothetical protein [Sulfurospirillum sp. UCH001]|uniref:hypothetical protein n=1 Tax=Sulfurospirillum sp. UCH001 TaxID=1581011 RepID=UPI00082EB1EA|nr:hypothetical protein [Sulfurospirillum sp. UCH001]
MTHEKFLEKQWQNYQTICNMKGMDAGTKEDYIKRQTPTYYKPDVLLEKTPKSPCLSVKTPILKAEENITLSRRELKRMLEEVALRAYELGIKESA